MRQLGPELFACKGQARGQVCLSVIRGDARVVAVGLACGARGAAVAMARPRAGARALAQPPRPTTSWLDVDAHEASPSEETTLARAAGHAPRTRSSSRRSLTLASSRLRRAAGRVPG